jgi:hypothetical protein
MKIGFVSNLYGTPKGHSYVIKQMLETFTEQNIETHMYRIGNNELLPEFPLPTTLKTEPSMIIPKDDFEKWLDETQPDWCIFVEYMQWWDEDHDKVAICKERNIKTMVFNMFEKLDWNKLAHYKLYTKLLAPTRFQTKLMRKHGLYQTCHIPWGVDLEEIDKVPMKRSDNKLRFFHCAGSGGVLNRKNTQTVIDAYKKIEDENTDLIITHLNSKVFSKDEIISFTKYSDVLVNVSKWDTIGINTLEANACGIPVIVANTEPMNELVQDRVNGLVVDGEARDVDIVTCKAYEVDVDELAKKMSFFKNKLLLDTFKTNARKFAETNFDWNKNKKHFLKMFEVN